MVFKKGEPSANPTGRPIGSISLVDILRQKLGRVPPGTDYSVAETIVDAYLEDVMTKPDMKRDLFDRIDGRAKQDIGLGGTDGKSAIDINIRMV